jgi:hypothetical protein
MRPIKMKQIIGRTVYDTERATLLAGNDYWDGHNFERDGTNTYLYRGFNGRYFAVYLTQWEDRSDTIKLLSQSEALDMYEDLRETRADFDVAFPGVKLEEA